MWQHFVTLGREDVAHELLKGNPLGPGDLLDLFLCAFWARGGKYEELEAALRRLEAGAGAGEGQPRRRTCTEPLVQARLDVLAALLVEAAAHDVGFRAARPLSASRRASSSSSSTRRHSKADVLKDIRREALGGAAPTPDLPSLEKLAALEGPRDREAFLRICPDFSAEAFRAEFIRRNLDIEDGRLAKVRSLGRFEYLRLAFGKS
eukprot:tig00020911_g15739.t1